jgi:malonate-semialdehyde dehydrogenase (acetylating)/methylmalonate-semialdehyde dehydrogenase
VEGLIESGTKDAKVLLDGRGYKVPGFEKGNWIGPTVIDHVKPGMRVYDEEIFGPVLIIVRVDTF